MKLAISFAMCAACAFAQFGGIGRNRGGQESSVRANIRGGGSADSGKCTIEADVDGTAEIFVSGQTARIRTLGGQPSYLRRMDCTAPMPRNAAEYRFTGVDGRGSQNLVSDPRSNGGTAVVRIDDQKGGREGYTFDIEWRGANGYFGNNNGGYNGNNRYPNNGAYPNDPNGYPNNRSTRRDDGYNGRDNGGYNGRDNGGYNGRNSGGYYGDNGNYNGWNNGWGNQVTYRGCGRGEFAAGNRAYRVNGANVNVDRNTGRVTVNLESDYGENALSFSGRIQRIEGNTILADVRSENGQFGTSGADGMMRISIGGNNRVQSIDMQGEGPGGPFRLNWRD